ncbi:MAG: SPOR domain-containing protein [Acidobacteriota bacterium]
MTEPRTHYQISLTARQAVGLFVGLLLSLGLAFFFGLMTGLPGRPGTQARAALPPDETSEAIPAVETAAPLPVASRAARESQPVAGNAAASAAEPTPPPTLQTFEDGTAEEAAVPAPEHPAPPPRTAKPAADASKAVPPAGRIWVQVAALSSRGEADALSQRLSRRGYRTQIVSDGPKGRLRVRVGPFRTTEDAHRAAEKLRTQDKVQSPWVVSEAR